jgi:hypothetical protein
VIRSEWDGQFVVNVFQAGAGTSYHMNVSEVLTDRAAEILGGSRGTCELVHPNDHVNMGQSTTDVYPTAIRLAALGVATVLSPDHRLPPGGRGGTQSRGVRQDDPPGCPGLPRGSAVAPPAPCGHLAILSAGDSGERRSAHSDGRRPRTCSPTAPAPSAPDEQRPGDSRDVVGGPGLEPGASCLWGKLSAVAYWSFCEGDTQKASARVRAPAFAGLAKVSVFSVAGPVEPAVPVKLVLPIGMG